MNTMAQAKRDFQIGYLTTYRIDRSPLNEGWLLHLGEGNAAGWLVDARSKEKRVFKTLDSVVSAIESIGFEVNSLR